MTNFKTRLFEEKAQLDERIEKLNSFQNSEEFKNIESFQETLLNIQLKAMYTYSQVLSERIRCLEQVGGSQA